MQPICSACSRVAPQLGICVLEPTGNSTAAQTLAASATCSRVAPQLGICVLEPTGNSTAAQTLAASAT